jgi:hypothetical protein
MKAKDYIEQYEHDAEAKENFIWEKLEDIVPVLCRMGNHCSRLRFVADNPTCEYTQDVPPVNWKFCHKVLLELERETETWNNCAGCKSLDYGHDGEKIFIFCDNRDCKIYEILNKE